MILTVNEKTTIAEGDFGRSHAIPMMQLEGRKQWLTLEKLRFETSRRNIDLFMRAFPSALVQDQRSSSRDAKVLPDHESSRVATPVPAFRLEPRKFQLENFERFKNQPQWAIFSEQGTGKTKVAIDIICHRWLSRATTGVIVLSSPKGVHAQWIEDQLPIHLWGSVQVKSAIWDGKTKPEFFGGDKAKLEIVSGNIDMVKSTKGYHLLEQFALRHKAKLMILVDESDSIKDLGSARSKKLRQLAALTTQRSIMTGTPIAKDLTDEYSQFFFLNPDIIGHKYLTSFRAQYCIMGGYENKSIVGHRNLGHFKSLTAPYIFRATKAELDLPAKVYDSVVFDLSDDQRRAIKDIRDKFFADLKTGTVSVKTGAVAVMRIQQISNGFAALEDGRIEELPNPRLDALLDLRRQVSGPVIIWCRFKEDVLRVSKAFPGSVTIYGDNSTKERADAKEMFLQMRTNELVATAGAAGRGTDGFQKVCTSAIYYSNSYSAIDRWQSEDRIHRIGMGASATYFDLIARGSIDRAILRNLRNKKDLSFAVLDDIKNIMEEI